MNQETISKKHGNSLLTLIFTKETPHAWKMNIVLYLYLIEYLLTIFTTLLLLFMNFLVQSAQKKKRNEAV